MMKNIAVSAATVAVCASTTGVMASTPEAKAVPVGPESSKKAPKKSTDKTKTNKQKRRSALPPATSRKATKKSQWEMKLTPEQRAEATEAVIKQANPTEPFHLVTGTAKLGSEPSDVILQKSHGHFVDQDTKQYYRFQVQPVADETAAGPETEGATAGTEGATPATAAPKASVPTTYELQVRKAPGLHDAWGLFAKEWKTVSGKFQHGVTDVNLEVRTEKPNPEASEEGEPKTLEEVKDATLTYEPRTYTARFLQIFFGFQQKLGWAMFKLACWLGAIYAALHFTVLKRAAVSDEEEGTSCMSDSEEEDSDVEDLESNLGESIRSGSVRSGSARASAAASVRSGSVKSSQA